MEDAKQVAARLGLEPMAPLSVASESNASELLRRMAGTAFGGRSLGEAADVMETMLRDDTFVVMTLTGAMTMAGLNPLIMQMMERGWVHALIATGALVGHGLVEDLGMMHYKADPRISDDEYYELRLNRVYDTLEPEENLDKMELIVREVFRALADSDARGEVGTWELLRFMGENLPGAGVLQVAARHGVHVYIPAFTDSELGLDFAIHQQARREQGRAPLSYDPFRDLNHYREQCQGALAAGKKLGIFTIGGGVPRNWAQQVGPFVDVRNKRLGLSDPPVRFTYGVRICPDPPHFGHLSGCTYSEGVSWGKFVPRSEGGRWAEVLTDGTIGWPLLVQAMIDRGL